MNMNPFASKTVADIVAPITKAVIDLGKIVEVKNKENDELANKIDQNDREINEAQRYKAVFEKLLNG